MSDDPSWLKQQREKCTHLNRWLMNYQAEAKIAPLVHEMLDYTEWLIGAVEQRPESAAGIPMPDLTRTTEYDISNLKHVLPLQPDYSPEALCGASAMTSSTLSALISYIGEVGSQGGPEGYTYWCTCQKTLEMLDSSYDREGELRDRLGRFLDDGLNSRLAAAKAAYDVYRIGTGDRPSTANAMRNLLCGVQGNLWEKARTYDKEPMTWVLMSQRLTMGIADGPEYQQLVDEERTFNGLVKDKLPKVLHLREGQNEIDISILWLELQSHLITVLRLVRL